MKHDYNGSVDATTIATTTIGFAQAQEFGGTGFVHKVVAEQEGANDAEFNVNVDGNAVFSSTQSVASADTPETFVPDQNRHYTGPSVQVEIDVTASSGTSGNLIVGVLTDDQGSSR